MGTSQIKEKELKFCFFTNAITQLFHPEHIPGSPREGMTVFDERFSDDLFSVEIDRLT